MACDAHGNPIDFEITGGEVHDAKAAAQVIEKIDEAENLIADKGYASEAVRDQARAAGVENLFARLKHFRPGPKYCYPLRKAGPQFQSYGLSCLHPDLAQTEMRTRPSAF